MGVVLDNWFTVLQNDLIKEKTEMIKYWTGDITFNLKIIDKYRDNGLLIFKVNTIIETEREHVKDLWQSINFHRELIDAAKRRYSNSELV